MPPESVGVLSAYTYCGTLDTPENKKFVDGYKARYNALPGSYQYMGYVAAKMVIQALKDINGRAEDRDAFIAALSKVQVKGPMGMASFDEHHGLVADFYPLTVEKGPDGQVAEPLRRTHPAGQGPLRYVPLRRSARSRRLALICVTPASGDELVAVARGGVIRDMHKMTHRLRHLCP